MFDLDGKTALVTGNSRGIGPYISRTLAQAGVTIIGVARSREGLQKTQQEIEAAGGTCYLIPFDLTAIKRLGELVDQARSLTGRIDILVNNAGMERYQGYQDNQPGEIAEILALNLHAPLELTRLLLPVMLESGGQIVTIASLAGKQGVGYNAVYSATKAGLIMWSDALRQELRGKSVGVAVICPGYIREAGMFADGGVKAPPLLGTSPPQAVADAVLRALQNGKGELIVNRGPIRPLLALGQLLPGLAEHLVRWFGVTKLSRMRADKSAPQKLIPGTRA